MDLASPSLACLLWPASIYLVACHLWSDYLLAVHPTLHILFCDSRAGAALQSPFLLCQQTSLYIRSLGTPRRMWRGRVEEVIYSMLCFWWSLLQFSFSGDYHFSTILYLSGDTSFRRGHQSPLHSLGIFRGTASLRPTWYSGTGHPSLPFSSPNVSLFPRLLTLMIPTFLPYFLNSRAGNLCLIDWNSFSLQLTIPHALLTSL